MNIIDAIKDPNLLHPFLADKQGSIKSWRNWLTALRVIYGLPIPPKRFDLVRQCTGRDPASLLGTKRTTNLLLVGRRSGKSRMAAVILAYTAALAGLESTLASGERGVVACVATTKRQGRIIKDYLRVIFELPMLAGEVVRETRDGFELRNHIRIEIMAGSFRSIRGYSLISCCVDEICFMGIDEECKINDTELIRAIRPALALSGGPLIAISSPWARRGWAFSTWQRCFGNDSARTLVWNCGSRVMNPTLPQSVVDDAIAEDLQAAKSEFLGEWRDDISSIFSRELIESLVVPERVQLFSEPGRYDGFVDISGGRSDGSALAIAHKVGRTTILDALYHVKAPHDPHQVIRTFAEHLKDYRIRRVTGDNYGAEFVAAAFAGCGIGYTKADKTASALYLELLPRMCSGECELLDNPLLVDQLASLERRTRVNGKDQVTHPVGGHDDAANAACGALVTAAGRRIVVGAAW